MASHKMETCACQKQIQATFLALQKLVSRLRYNCDHSGASLSTYIVNTDLFDNFGSYDNTSMDSYPKCLVCGLQSSSRVYIGYSKSHRPIEKRELEFSGLYDSYECNDSCENKCEHKNLCTKVCESIVPCDFIELVKEDLSSFLHSDIVNIIVQYLENYNYLEESIVRLNHNYARILMFKCKDDVFLTDF